MDYTAAEVTGLAHVPVAALRRYDETGLVRARARAENGEHLYGDEDLERLFLVQTYEELGLDTDSIATLLGERPTTAAHLRTARRLLASRRRRIESLLNVLATALEYEESGPAMTAEEKVRMLADWREQERDQEMHLPSQRGSGTLAVDMKS